MKNIYTYTGGDQAEIGAVLQVLHKFKFIKKALSQNYF